MVHSPDESLILTVIEILWRDLEGGGLGPLETYLARWPGFEAAVREEYEALRVRHLREEKSDPDVPLARRRSGAG